MVAATGFPDERDVSNWTSADDCCELVRTPRSTVCDWPKRGVGSRVAGFPRVSRFCITVVQARPFLIPTTVQRARVHSDG